MSNDSNINENESQENQTPPVLTIDDRKYLFNDLADTTKSLCNDLFRTVAEYNELIKSYDQSLTLANTYVSGLRDEVEKVGLPKATEEAPGSLTIDDNIYDGSDMPDSVKEYVSNLVRANQSKTNLEYRLRQLDAARGTFITIIKEQIESSELQPIE